MGGTVIPDALQAPHAPADQPLALKVASVVRYRFFLYAGLLPYFLGAAWAKGVEHQFKAGIFWLGLLGIFLSVVGVEAFNEYFDAKMGTDRVFNPSDDEYIPEWMFNVGVGAFSAAATIGLYLAKDGGWPIVLYTLLGGAAAVWYVGPPIRWVYRGLGELVIGLSYGPWMTLGSLHLHTHRFSFGALFASLVPGLLIMALAVVNNIPDFHQDRLVGKRNLVVRLGRQRGVYVYLALAAAGLLVALLGSMFGAFPSLTAVAAICGAPLWISSAQAAWTTWDTPRQFVPAVKYIVLCYAVSTSVFALAILAGK
ncbi:MAG: prenyltransferase [Elusimicrobia bacterium]|nr:prenyltransferase [Elusimicrobiota bacterium]